MGEDRFVCSVSPERVSPLITSLRIRFLLFCNFKRGRKKRRFVLFIIFVYKIFEISPIADKSLATIFTNYQMKTISLCNIVVSP